MKKRLKGEANLEFTVNRAMMPAVKELAPFDGHLNLNGFPW